MKLGELAKVNNHSTTVFYSKSTDTYVDEDEDGKHFIFKGGRIKNGSGQTLKVYVDEY